MRIVYENNHVTAVGKYKNAVVEDVAAGKNYLYDSEGTYLTLNRIQLTKSDIGLGNVDNTSDLNKPVSIAVQALLDSKQNVPDTSTIEFGWNSHTQTTQYPYMSDLGLNWARVDFNWYSIQPTDGSSFSWTTTDTVMAAALTYGRKLTAVLAYAPTWATVGGSNVPTNVVDYATFAAACVARYAPQGLKTWEIWNEPNASGWLPAPDTTKYTALLKAAYAAMKAVDPTITVLFGGLAPVGTDATHLHPTTFLQQAYTNGAHGFFDAMNYHPYGWNTSHLQGMRQAMIDNGDTAKKMWFTEYGDPTFGGTGQSFTTESKAAYAMSDTIRKARALDYAGNFIAYESRDSQTFTTSSPDREGFFGILRNDFSFKPSYYALGNAVQRRIYASNPEEPIVRGLITAGTSVTITGTGQRNDPYVINSTASGSGNIDGGAPGSTYGATTPIDGGTP